MTGPNATPDDPLALPLDAFLAGPGGDMDALDIDRRRGKDLDRVLREMRKDDPDSVSFAPDAPRTPSDLAEGYSFVDVPSGLLLLAPDGSVAGAYVSCDLSVAEAHQGRGLGAELVLEYAVRRGSLPTWHLDTPAYTPAGLGAHRRAWILARRDPEHPDLLRRKRARNVALDQP